MFKQVNNQRLQLEYQRKVDVTIATPLQLAEAGEHHTFLFVQKEMIQLNLRTENEVWGDEARSGEIVYLPSGISCTVSSQSVYPAKISLFYFKVSGLWHEEAAESLLKRVGIRNKRIYRQHLPQVYHWLKDFARFERQPDLSTYLLLQARLNEIMASLLSIGQGRTGEENDTPLYVQQVKKYLLQHADADIDIEHLARAAGYSTSRFYRQFKKQTGLSPRKFVTSARLDQALMLLGSSQFSVAEVAHTVGYTDEHYFCRLFKKQMGISPTVYAKRAKIRIACLTAVFHGDLKVLGITPELVLRREWLNDPFSYLPQIAKVHPELILVPDIADELCDALRKIAPVFRIKWKGFPWRERLLTISELIGIPTVAERWLTYYEMKVGNARHLLAQRMGEQPFLVVSVYQQLYRVYGLQRKKIADLFYGELNLTVPDRVQHEGFVDLRSLAEVADLQCPNVIFLLPDGLSGHDSVTLEKEWDRLTRKWYWGRPRVLVIHHPDPLLYNADFYEQLIDQLVALLLQQGT